jgi:hypothetical protein
MSNLLLSKSSFIHIPKCAGTFLQAFLFHLNLPKHRYSEPQDGHLFLHQMPDSKDTYNFTFVRHPYTWWPSFYEWSKNTRFSSMEKECLNFDIWVKNYGAFWMGHYTKIVKRYIGEDENYYNGTKIDFIGKTETLFDDLFVALKNAGEEFSEKRYRLLVQESNQKESLTKWSNKQEYNREISDESKEIIYKTEKWVFDRFNYNY